MPLRGKEIRDDSPDRREDELRTENILRGALMAGNMFEADFALIHSMSDHETSLFLTEAHVPYDEFLSSCVAIATRHIDLRNMQEEIPEWLQAHRDLRIGGIYALTYQLLRDKLLDHEMRNQLLEHVVSELKHPETYEGKWTRTMVFTHPLDWMAFIDTYDTKPHIKRSLARDAVTAHDPDNAQSACVFLRIMMKYHTTLHALYGSFTSLHEQTYVTGKLRRLMRTALSSEPTDRNFHQDYKLILREFETFLVNRDVATPDDVVQDLYQYIASATPKKEAGDFIRQSLIRSVVSRYEWPEIEQSQSGHELFQNITTNFGESISTDTALEIALHYPRTLAQDETRAAALSIYLTRVIQPGLYALTYPDETVHTPTHLYRNRLTLLTLLEYYQKPDTSDAERKSIRKLFGGALLSDMQHLVAVKQRYGYLNNDLDALIDDVTKKLRIMEIPVHLIYQLS